LGSTRVTLIKGRQKLYYLAQIEGHNRFAVQWEIICNNDNNKKHEQNAIGQMLAKRIHDITSVTIRKKGINNEGKLNNIESISNNDILPSNKWREECLYYVTEWLLIAINKKSLRLRESNYMQNKLQLLYDSARETDVENLKLLHTAKVNATELHDSKMRRPNYSFFLFGAYIKRICEASLIDQALTLDASMMITKITTFLRKSRRLRHLLTDIMKYDVTQDEKQEIINIITITYIRMRGKDYTRKIMENLKRDLLIAHCSQMACLSNLKLRLKNIVVTKNNDGKEEQEDLSEEYKEIEILETK